MLSPSNSNSPDYGNCSTKMDSSKAEIVDLLNYSRKKQVKFFVDSDDDIPTCGRTAEEHLEIRSIKGLTLVLIWYITSELVLYLETYIIVIRKTDEYFVCK